jgi:RNA polymerase sigma-70 factor (ECF subfamily)
MVHRIETSTDAFARLRPRLFGVAYRMLGTIGDAEDVLQDAYLRWHRLDPAARDEVANTSAYLVRLVTRLCLDVLKSAHARRIDYVGPWLPEPLVDDAVDHLTHDPAGAQALADDLSIAFLVLLERLTPAERAVLLLRESFDFGYRDIARVVGKTEANCRQIERRARQRLAEGGRAPRPADRETHERLLGRFLRATRDGDLDGLLAVLATDVVSYADGGGRVTAARRPVVGAAHVARFLLGLRRLASADVELRPGLVNGSPGLLTYRAGRLHNVVSVHVEDDRIRRIFIVVNPDKLRAPSR